MAKVEFADVNNDQAGGSEKEDIRTFADRFGQTTALIHKKDLVADLLSRRPTVKYAKIIDALAVLSDRKRCIEYIAAYKGKLSLLENLSLSRRLANLNRRLEKQAGAIYARIISKDRQGRKFDEIIMGNISQLIKKNEAGVLELVLQKMSKFKQTEEASRIYASFISDLTFAVHIVNSIKDNGITEQSIEEVLSRSASRLLKAGMRTILQNVFFMDPHFALFKQKIQELLHEMRKQELDKEAEGGPGQVREISLAELSHVADLDEFLAKASVITERDQKYIKEVARLFDLHLNKPLLSIYQLLKFPLDREVFWRWMQKAPLPSGLLPEIESEIEGIKAGFEKNSEAIIPPTGYEKLLTLIYDYKICFTDKYKLITQVLKNHTEKEALIYCLDQIKNIQYKIENRFLTVVLGQLENCFSFSEAQKILLEDQKKIRQRIEGYKVKLKKNIDSLLQGEGGQHYAVLPSVLKYAAQEKIISGDGFLQIDRQVNPEHRLGFIVRLANSLIGFYFLLNCKLILDLLKKYFNSLRVSDGVFLRHKLSNITKEEIYELCAHYTHEKPVVIENLKKYLNWGKTEKEVRKHVLARLGVNEGFAPEFNTGKYRFTGIKYGSSMALRIFDLENKVRFAKNVPGVNTFLDFMNIIKQNKIGNLIKFGDGSLKVLYQNIHLYAVAELYGYVEERLRLLTLPNSLFRLTSHEIRMEYEKSASPDEYVTKLVASGEQERALRNTLLGKLDQELKITPTGEEEIVRRVKLEIQNQKAALEHLGTILDFVRNLPQNGVRVRASVPVSVDEVKKHLRMHRIADNVLYLDDLEQKADSSPGRGAISAFIAKLPKAEVFVTDDSVYEGRYESMDQAKQGLEDALLLRSVEDNLDFLKQILNTGKNEFSARSAYVNKHNRYKKGSPGFLLFDREVEEQHALLKTISRLLDFISHEIAVLEEVKKLNDAAEKKFTVLSEHMQDQDPVTQAQTFARQMQQLTDPRQKLNVAAKFLVTSQVREVIQSSEQIINGGSVNRYKILLALYNILDQQQDHEVKVKILDEFCEYLEKNRPEIYLQLKDLLDTQRDNLRSRYQLKRAKISDLWRVLEAVDKPEDKLKHLNELLEDREWSTFYSYIEHIKQGLLAENVDQMLERNKHLPLEDQHDLLEKTRLFRSEEYDTPEISEKISYKLLELNARRSVLTDTKKRIFSAQTYSHLMRIPASQAKVLKSINSTLFKEERKAVENEFKAHGMPEHEVKKYLNANLGSERDVSTFSPLQAEIKPEARVREAPRTVSAPLKRESGRPQIKTEVKTGRTVVLPIKESAVGARSGNEPMTGIPEKAKPPVPAAKGKVAPGLPASAAKPENGPSGPVSVEERPHVPAAPAGDGEQTRNKQPGPPSKKAPAGDGEKTRNKVTKSPGPPSKKAPAGDGEKTRNKQPGPVQAQAQEKQTERTQTQAHTEVRDNRPGAPRIEIKDLGTAREIFGTVRQGEEQELIAEIQKAVYNKKYQEAMNKIQNRVIWENGKSGALDKMSRLLFTLQDIPLIRENDEMSEFMDKQLHTLSSVIITQAQKILDQDSEKRTALASKNIIVSPTEEDTQATSARQAGQAGAEPGKTVKDGLRALITALEALDEFTDLHVFADARGFEEHEEKRLERIMGELGTRGNFIYLEKERMLLGQGRLKSLIRKAFDEHTSGKHVSVNPQLLKKAWDLIRNKGDLQTQLRLIGAGSQEERGDLFKELDRMLGPQTTPMVKLSKQKLFSPKADQAQAQDAPAREQGEQPDTHTSQNRPRKPAAHRVKTKPKTKIAAKPAKTSYKLTMQKYIAKSYAPLITDYMRRMYKHKEDFFIPLSGRRQYYTEDVLRRSVEGMLRKDAKGRPHTDLLHSLKQDERLFPMILQELFVQYKATQGQIFYFPRFLKGEIKINN